METKTVYKAVCGKLKVEVEEDKFRNGGTEDTIRLMSNGRQTYGVIINPELAEMTIKALQKYLEYKRQGVDKLSDSFNEEYIKCINGSEITSELMFSARQLVSKLGELGLVQDNYETIKEVIGE